jgi:hypothetical protein
LKNKWNKLLNAVFGIYILALIALRGRGMTPMMGIIIVVSTGIQQTN